MEVLVESEYSGFPLRFVCLSERDIEEAVAQINVIAEALAKTNRVYFRRAIEKWKDRSFETGQSWTYVTARLAYSPVEPYGIFTVDRSYDNDNMVSGFGLAPIKEESTTVCRYCYNKPKECICGT